MKILIAIVVIFILIIYPIIKISSICSREEEKMKGW